MQITSHTGTVGGSISDSSTPSKTQQRKTIPDSTADCQAADTVTLSKPSDENLTNNGKILAPDK
jgi:hypothetical protein